MCGMKNSVITKLFSGFLVFAVFSGMIGLAAADEDSAQNNLPARKIVVFKKGASEFDKSDALRRAGGSLIKKLRQRDMAAVALDEDSAAALSKDARVLRIEDDAVVEALETVGGNNKQKQTATNPHLSRRRFCRGESTKLTRSKCGHWAELVWALMSE